MVAPTDKSFGEGAYHDRTPPSPLGSCPTELKGWTWRIPFDENHLYVTVNHNGARVIEIFVANGVLSMSVGLLASRLLRSGATAEEIALSLDRINGTHRIAFENEIITSPEQAVSACLRLTLSRLR